MVDDSAADDLENSLEDGAILPVQSSVTQDIVATPAPLERSLKLLDCETSLVQGSELPGCSENTAVGNITGIQHDGVWGWEWMNGGPGRTCTVTFRVKVGCSRCLSYRAVGWDDAHPGLAPGLPVLQTGDSSLHHVRVCEVGVINGVCTHTAAVTGRDATVTS